MKRVKRVGMGDDGHSCFSLGESSPFKALLDEQYHFPCLYTFKFVVGAGQKAFVLEILGKGVMVKERSSKTGKYLGLTVSRSVDSSDEIIEIYREVSKIEGVFAL